MTRTPPHRDDVCPLAYQRKYTRWQAWKNLRALNRKSKPFYRYRCETCDMWHILHR
jgi:hypothetical protein